MFSRFSIGTESTEVNSALLSPHLVGMLTLAKRYPVQARARDDTFNTLMQPSYLHTSLQEPITTGRMRGQSIHCGAKAFAVGAKAFSVGAKPLSCTNPWEEEDERDGLICPICSSKEVPCHGANKRKGNIARKQSYLQQDFFSFFFSSPSPSFSFFFTLLIC